MNQLAVKDAEPLARPLNTLVPLIKDELRLAYTAGLEHYKKVGELLQEAYWQVTNRGESWQAWLVKNFTLSESTARNYMGLAEELHFREIEEASSNQTDTKAERAQKTQRTEIKTLSDFTHPNRDKGHRPDWHKPVQQQVNKLNVAKIRQEYEDRVKENKVIRELALQLIDIGYKVLVTKLHPDKGGSQEAIQRLNDIRRSLKHFTEEEWNNK